MAATSINRTNTNIEAYVKRYTDTLASFTEAVGLAISSKDIAKCAAAALNRLVWTSPVLAVQVAPKMFTAAFIIGGFTEALSPINMQKIFTNINKILSIGDSSQKTTLKVSLIFAIVIANGVSYIPLPELSKLYASIAGGLLGMQMGRLVPRTTVEAIVQFLDRWIPLPTCPSGYKSPEAARTNIEAYFDYVTGWIALLTETVSDALSSKGVANYVASTLNQVVWTSPLLTAQMAPKTFAAAFALGGAAGLFSSDSMEKIFNNVDIILSGGKDNQNTNFKVSLIFAVVIVSKFSSIVPSLPLLYAAFGGVVLGIKLSEWVPEKTAISAAQYIDRIVPLPICPGFIPQVNKK